MFHSSNGHTYFITDPFYLFKWKHGDDYPSPLTDSPFPSDMQRPKRVFKCSSAFQPDSHNKLNDIFTHRSRIQETIKKLFPASEEEISLCP